MTVLSGAEEVVEGFAHCLSLCEVEREEEGQKEEIDDGIVGEGAVQVDVGEGGVEEEVEELQTGNCSRRKRGRKEGRATRRLDIYGREAVDGRSSQAAK